MIVNCILWKAWRLVIIILLYFLVLLLVGVYFKNRSKSIEDFYLSGRNLPCVVVMFTFAATWIGASSTLAKSGLAYQVGFSALSPTLATVFALLVFSLISPRIRRIGAQYGITSIPDLFLRRFGKTTSMLSALIIAWTLVGTVATQMVATSSLFQIILKPYGHFSYELALVLSLALVVGYTLLSGFYGVAYTDVIQGLFLLVTIGGLLVFEALDLAGGWKQLRTTLPDSFFSLKPNLTLVGYSWVYLLYFLAGPPYWQRAFASNSEKSARWGAFGGNVIILIYSAGVTLIGVCAAAIYQSFPHGASHEMLIPIMVNELFPPLMYQVVLAALICVLMSTIDSYLILAAQTITNDVYKLIRPNVGDAQRLKASKWAILALGLAALVFALNIRIILDALVLAYTFFSSAIAFPALAALLWRRTTTAGALSGMIAGLVTAGAWSALANPYGLHEAIPGGIVSLLAVLSVSFMTYDPKKPGTFLA